MELYKLSKLKGRQKKAKRVGRGSKAIECYDH